MIRSMGRKDLPSVMPFHARYNTPTDAVSNKVATKEPSTFELEPYKRRRKKVRTHMSVLNLKKPKITLQMTRLSRNQAS